MALLIRVNLKRGSQLEVVPLDLWSSDLFRLFHLVFQVSLSKMNLYILGGIKDLKLRLDLEVYSIFPFEICSLYVVTLTVTQILDIPPPGARSEFIGIPSG